MDSESEKFFGLINNTIDVMMIAGAMRGIADLALRANAAYNDALQTKTQHVPNEDNN